MSSVSHQSRSRENLLQGVPEGNSELIACFSVIIGTTLCRGIHNKNYNDFRCQESSSQVLILHGQVKLDEVISMKAGILVS